MEHTQVRTSKTNRALASTGSFSFIRVAENSKSGAWSTEDADNKWTSSKNQSPRPFASYEHNQGIIPKNKGLILDLDVDKKASPAEQSASLDTALTVLSELFGSETIDSATINSTAGGGRHVYLELSHSPTAPLKAGSLSRLDGRLRGEVRIAGANAYVLADGSVVDGGHYRNIQGNGTLPTLSEEATERLFAVYAEDGAVDGDDANTAALIAEFEAGEHKRKKSVSQQDFMRVKAYVEAKREFASADIASKKCGSAPKFYFRQIGSLYEAMSHCYSLNAIAATAVRLGIAKSSDGGYPRAARNLSAGELRQQLSWHMKKKGRSAASQCCKCSRKLSGASSKASGAVDADKPTDAADNAHRAVIELAERILRTRANGRVQNTFSRHYVVTDRTALSVALLAAAPKWARKQSETKAKSSAKAKAKADAEAGNEGKNEDTTKKTKKRTHRSHKKVYKATRYAYWIMLAWFDAHRQMGRRNIWGYVAGIQEAVEQQFGVKLTKTQVRDGISYLKLAGVIELIQSQAFHADTGGISSVYRVRLARKKVKAGALKGKRAPKFVDTEATNELLFALYKRQVDSAESGVLYRELSFEASTGAIRAGRIDESGVYAEGQLVHVYENARVRYAQWLWSYAELLGTDDEKALAAKLKALIGPVDASELDRYWTAEVSELFAGVVTSKAALSAELVGSDEDTEVVDDELAGISFVGFEDADNAESASKSFAETTATNPADTADEAVTAVSAASEGSVSIQATGSTDETPSFADRVTAASGAYRLVDGADIVDTRTGEVIAEGVMDESFPSGDAETVLMLLDTGEEIENKTKIANGLARAYKNIKAAEPLTAKESELVVRIGFRSGVDVQEEFFEQQDYLDFLLPLLARMRTELDELRFEEQNLLEVLEYSQSRREALEEAGLVSDDRDTSSIREDD